MNAYLKFLEDKLGVRFYPKTITKAILGKNMDAIGEKLVYGEDTIDAPMIPDTSFLNGDVSQTDVTADTITDSFPDVPKSGKLKTLLGYMVKSLSDWGVLRPSISTKALGNIIYYVSPSGFNDTGTGTAEKPYSTIQYAINMIPKNLDGYTAKVIIADGTYDETVNVNGFYGGLLEIKSQNNPETLNTLCRVTRILLNDCQTRINVLGLYFTQIDKDAFGATNCTMVYVRSCQAIESATTAYGFNFLYSRVRIWNCRSMNHKVCIRSYASDVSSEEWTTDSSAVEYGLSVDIGGKIFKVGNQPTGGIKPEFIAAGGTIVSKYGGITATLQNSITLYVSPTGSDTNDGSSSKPYKTIQCALEMIPKNMNGYTAYIVIADGAYDESLDIRGFYGGILEIRSQTSSTALNTVCKVKQAIINRCPAKIQIFGLYFTQTNNIAVDVSDCGLVYLNYCQAIESAPASVAFNFNYSKARITYCRSINHINCIKAYMSEISSQNWIDSSAIDYGFESGTGSTISKLGSQPLGTKADEYMSNGGIIISKYGAQIGSLPWDTTIYVSPNGSDLAGSGSNSSPFKTIKYALDMIPRDLGGYTATIYLADGTYDESVVVNGYHSGVMEIKSQANPEALSTVCKVRKINIVNCSARIQVYGLYLTQKDDVALTTATCNMIYVRCCQAIESATTSIAFNFSYTKARVSGCKALSHSHCIKAFHSEVSSENWVDSSAADYGLWSDTGSKISKAGIQPTGALGPETISNGGIMVSKYSARIGSLQGTLSLYVSNTGSDTTGSGTSSAPYKTIQYTLDMIPKDLGGNNATIYLADGTYDELVTINGFNSGTLEIRSQSNPETLTTLCKVKRIVIKNCSARVQVYGIYLTQTNDTALSADTCSFVYVKCCQAIESAPSSFAFYFMYSTARVSGCKSLNHINCINAFHASVSSETWIDSLAIEYGLLSNAGSKISKAGNQPLGTKGPEFMLSGGTIIDKSGTISIGELREDTNLYVATTGNDTTGNGTQANPFKTIKYALSLIPKNLGGYVADIYIADGTYNEDIDLRGYNSGILEFKSVSSPNALNTVCRVKKIYASDCTARIRFYGLYLTLTNGDAFVTNNCATVFASSCQAIESGPDSCGFNISYSNARLIACKSTNHQICCRAFFSEISSENWVSSSGSKYGISIENCSIISKIGVQPTGTEANEYINDGGGVIINKNGDKIGALQRNSGVTEITLKADNWNDGPAPYMQAVSIPGVTNDMEGMVLNALADGATPAEQTAYNDAFRIITTGTAMLADYGPNVVSSAVSFWESGSYNNIDGIKLAHASRIRTIQLVKVNPSTAYQFSVNSSVPNMFIGVRAYDKNMNFVSSWESATESQFIKTTGGNEHYLGIIVWNSVDKFTSAELIAFLQDGSIKPYIGLSGGSAIFKVYDKPATDIKIGLKGV